MSHRKNKNRGAQDRGINPQGQAEDAEFSANPKSELENKAKKSNTKI
ncbi:small, acid-soluble spore protein L [Bacillus solimangrovi]|uniref:Small, acid-soluble spore protein L n=1 Tax=Bacillus solimangrovi TaxID=1305675 RepID=A0A1E5LIZ9_9BACI|nr:small, acid-soluble spore protein L [Bacillus solimangrovi]OEH94054.1 small, acid-soluble spore protein L [Bacillus solimangrovi]